MSNKITLVNLNLKEEQFIDLYKTLGSVTALADLLGVSQSTMSNLAKSLGLAVTNKGRKHPENRGDNNPSRRPEVRKKLSELRRARLESGWINPHTNKGQTWTQNLSPEQQERSRQKNIGRHHTEATKQKIREKLLFRIQNGQQIPTKNTQIELRVQAALKKEQIQFTTQRIVNYYTDEGGKRFTVPDIFIEPNICVFVDGCRWHGCPQHYKEYEKELKEYTPTSRSIVGKQIKECLVDVLLTEQGYFSIRLWGHDVTHNLDICVQKVKEVLGAHTHTS